MPTSVRRRASARGDVGRLRAARGRGILGPSGYVLVMRRSCERGSRV